jgi:hypothetical protein
VRDVLISKAVADRLAHLAALGDNWDSFGSPPVTAAALALARRVIERGVSILEEAGSVSPDPYHVAPIPGGGVQIEWRIEDRGLEVDVLPDGRIDITRAEGLTSAPAYEDHEQVPTEALDSFLREFAA